MKALEDYIRLYCIAHALDVVVGSEDHTSVKYATLIERVIKSSPEAVALIEKCTVWVREAREKLPKKKART